MPKHWRCLASRPRPIHVQLQARWHAPRRGGLQGTLGEGLGVHGAGHCLGGWG